MQLKTHHLFLLFSLFIAGCQSPRESRNDIEEGLTEDDRTESDNQEAPPLENPENQTDIWTQKAKRGIDFVAMGNEPSWSLEIDFEKSMIFTSLNEPDTLVTPVPAGLKSGAITATSYTAETENGTLSITLSEQNCSDAMSGEGFDYKVSISAKSVQMANAAAFTGCGRYLSDNPLHGTWQLESLGSQSASKIFDSNKPYLTFRVNEEKLTGYGGCNRLSGTIQVDGETIVFSPIVSTKMACPDMEAEQHFLQSITEQEAVFSIDGENLILKTAIDELTFEKLMEIPDN